MRIKLITALVCLIALCVELALDSSTPFVRDHGSSTNIGKLVITKDFNPNQDQKPDNPSNDLDLLGVSAHAGSIAVIIAFVVILMVSTYQVIFTTPQLEFRVTDLQRPPSIKV